MSAYKQIGEAAERDEHLRRGHDRLVPLVTACIAVLAALGSLFAHHRSITALAVKNDSIIATAKATDQYSDYQSRRSTALLLGALADAKIATAPTSIASMRVQADGEERAAITILAKAQAFEKTALDESERSEALLSSFETLEIGVTLFEIAIVFASISALTDSRMLLYGAIGMSAIGIAFAAVGFFQAH